jgi:hypothetical protein
VSSEARLELAVGTVARVVTVLNGETFNVRGTVTCVYPYEHTADTLKTGGIIASTDGGWSVKVRDGPFPQMITLVAKGNSSVRESMRSYRFARQVSETRERTRNADVIAAFNAAQKDIDDLTHRFNRGENLSPDN